MPLICANCRETVASRANTGNRGPDIAWMNHCRDCADQVQDQMRVVEHRPTGAAIDILQCVDCGTLRACRPRWRTRCPVCLDGRTVLDDDTLADMKSLRRRPGNRDALAYVFEVPPESVTENQALMVESAGFLATLEESYARPRWTVLATDVRGMPWGYRDTGTSHGTWAVHDPCGTVQKVTLAMPECRACPPLPGSRTHRSKIGQPQYLYVVRYLDLLKFGHGDANRVRAHLRAGSEVVSVLRANHEHVVLAELQLRRSLASQLIDPRQWNLPVTFGAGSEVVPDDVSVDLTQHLSGPGVRDVTSSFRRG